MPKYWENNYFAHGKFPEVGHKQKTEKKERKKEERKLVITMASVPSRPPGPPAVPGVLPIKKEITWGKVYFIIFNNFLRLVLIAFISDLLAPPYLS